MSFIPAKRSEFFVQTVRGMGPRRAGAAFARIALAGESVNRISLVELLQEAFDEHDVQTAMRSYDHTIEHNRRTGGTDPGESQEAPPTREDPKGAGDSASHTRTRAEQ